MANLEHIAILQQGVEVWNQWRKQNPSIEPNLSRVVLDGAMLPGINLRGAYLFGTTFMRAKLDNAQLSSADLAGTVLSGASFIGADFTQAILLAANFGGAEARTSGVDDAPSDTMFCSISPGPQVSGANFTKVMLGSTAFIHTDLSKVVGLETCIHSRSSIVDYETLVKSGQLPISFLRGVGLPDNLIEYLPSLLNQPIQFYSCFISYSSKDVEFTQRLHADLQNKGVRCWFAPHDMKIGAKILDTIDEAIRLREKVLLILSEQSISSEWVEDEVSTAFAEERSRNQTVLFPIRIDAAIMDTNEAWARKLRDSRHIGDFSKWKDHDSYKKGLERLMRDLKVE
jgi:hypothetical protein